MAFRAPQSVAYYRGNVLVTGPAIEPVTADELREQLRTDATDLPDAQANAYITEAREELEEQTGLALIAQTWRLSLDGWPTGRSEAWWDGVRDGAISSFDGTANSIEMPRYPLSGVASVTTYAADDTATVVSIADTFTIDRGRKPGRLVLNRGAVPPTGTRPANAIEIVYTSGYGLAESDVPAPLRRAVRSMAAYLYQHRGDCGGGDAFTGSGASAVAAKYMAARL